MRGIARAELEPEVAMSPELFLCVLSSYGVIRVVCFDIPVAVETQWDAVVECMVTSIFRLLDVVQLHLCSTELVANAAGSLAGKQRFLCHTGREVLHSSFCPQQSLYCILLHLSRYPKRNCSISGY